MADPGQDAFLLLLKKSGNRLHRRCRYLPRRVFIIILRETCIPECFTTTAMRSIFILAALLATITVTAQNNDRPVSVLNAVTISGIQKQTYRHTPFNIAVLPLQQLRSTSFLSLSDALSKIPGISQLTTGPGISKPVIRGLYGNRIQVIMLGLRFDNQQWQDEHGLGVTVAGIDHIEVIKGPASVLYGTDAAGGVIRVAEEKILPAGSASSDCSASIFSNTVGFSLNAGTRKNTGKKNWRIRISADNHADYSDGNNKRILNSRFAVYNVKTALGFSGKKWTQQYNFFSSFGRYGFITRDNTDKKIPDARLSRKFDGPNHTVFFNMLSSENSRNFKNSRLEINTGIHSNLRMENEGGNHVSLNMLITAFSSNIKWYKPITGQTELILANQSHYQWSTNYGSRVIIPDAHLFETSLSVYLKKKWRRADIEMGISAGDIHTRSLRTINMDYTSGAIYPFSKWQPSLNGNAGISINTPTGWNFKFNTSTGYRAPNLAELSSNGLHEGSSRYEIGNPHMKTEQNLNTELTINYESRWIDIYASSYLNLFMNYIYLAPAGTQLYGFDIYRFLQGSAKLYGGELSAYLKPAKKWTVTASYSRVTGKLGSGKMLPFIPADKLTNDIIVSFCEALSFKTGTDIFFAQHRPGDFETPSPGYWLLHSSLVCRLSGKKQPVTLSIAGDNLLNTTYFDHLSRFKYFNICNTGRNLMITLSVPLNKKTTT